ncbi:MAG: hypothetical protein QXF88_01330 [Candidatus Aenigmatarchaeota archaeon]
MRPVYSASPEEYFVASDDRFCYLETEDSRYGIYLFETSKGRIVALEIPELKSIMIVGIYDGVSIDYCFMPWPNTSVLIKTLVMEEKEYHEIRSEVMSWAKKHGRFENIYIYSRPSSFAIL